MIITVRSGRSLAWNTSATRMLLVTTVRFGTVINSVASCMVVVPAVRPIAAPAPMSTAADTAIARFSSVLRRSLASKPGSSVAVRVADGGAAVHLHHESGFVEHVEIAAHGHLADVELGGEISHPGRSGAADLAHDQFVTPAGQRWSAPAGHRRTR